MCSLYFILASVFYHWQHKNTACLEALPWNVSPCLSKLHAPASRHGSRLLPTTSPMRPARCCRDTRGASIPFPPCPGSQRRRNMQKQEQEALCRITDKLPLAILFLGFPSNDRNVNFFFSCFQTAFFNIFSLFICLSSPKKIWINM